MEPRFPTNVQTDPIAFPILEQEDITAIAQFGTRRATTAGETLYEQGDTRYDFYLVVSGVVEVLVDPRDSEESIVSYVAGQFLGELSLLTGLRAFVTTRVVQGGEVIAVARERFRDLMSTHPALGDKILTAYIARRTNLLSIGTSTTRVIGPRHSKETHRIREFLSRLSIPHEWVDPDRHQDVDALLDRFGVERAELPTVISSGTVLRNATPGRLSEFLGLTLESHLERYFDLVVVGAGPAGLAACVYGASEGLSTLGVDGFGAGGQAGTTTRIENYLGFPTGLSGRELAQRALVQAEKFGALLNAPCEVDSLRVEEGNLVLRFSDGTEVVGRAVVAATGARYRRLGAKRLEEFEGGSVYYAATYLEARSCESEPIVVVGGGNSAGQAALFLAETCSKVTIVIRSSDLGVGMSQYLVDRVSAHPRITIRTDSEVTELLGDSALESVRISTSGGEAKDVPCRALFSFIGAEPASHWLPEGIALDDHGFVLTDRQLGDRWPSGPGNAGERAPLPYESNLPGLFAVGDVRSESIKRVAAAVGEGSACIASVHGFLSLTDSSPRSAA